MINCIHIRAAVLYAGDVVFGRAAAGHGFGELLAIGCVCHGDDAGAFGHGDGQVEVIVGIDEAFVLVLGHVAVQVV